MYLMMTMTMLDGGLYLREVVQVREDDLLRGDPRRGAGAEIGGAPRLRVVVAAPPRPGSAGAARPCGDPLALPAGASRARGLQLDRLELGQHAYGEVRERGSTLVELVHRTALLRRLGCAHRLVGCRLWMSGIWPGRFRGIGVHDVPSGRDHRVYRLRRE